MLKTPIKQHWDSVYENKTPNQVSWTQEKPETSLNLIQDAGLPKTAKIIDIGGGDSKLVDYLLEEGYKNITVLDISVKSLDKAIKRLGNKASKVTWIVSDISTFKPDVVYDLWHDRAAFHFLTLKEEIERYQAIVANFVSDSLIIGTFSKNGPTKCSGLKISQYNEQELIKKFKNHFKKEDCLTTDHITPFNTVQNFQFCRLKKLK
ncbi:MAG TPA: SAM-dependent methyltransferase [Maribacter sp.]|uniref:class I SAM-dependent methyltransferase n=1 Tax=unclassified Maribacter TaxID=2615042 RepID=UPI000EE15349|nr:MULTISPECIES: class I SAM-dependent methyltransferase [unclassified Maribacter]HAF78322.1 SAM-dependent methyltransferase [Maribacter sp.]|tara:strand:- start:5358 stop:5975 length:618 start_codon:yes stop_codon:yes gene_type:complete